MCNPDAMPWTDEGHFWVAEDLSAGIAVQDGVQGVDEANSPWLPCTCSRCGAHGCTRWVNGPHRWENGLPYPIRIAEVGKLGEKITLIHIAACGNRNG